MSANTITQDELENGTEWLHLFAQEQWHGGAYIVGTRKGIEALRDALTQALESPKGVGIAQGFTNDGEGYFTHAYVVPFAEMDRMQLPYTDREMFNPAGQQGCLWPWQLPHQPQEPTA